MLDQAVDVDVRPGLIGQAFVARSILANFPYSVLSMQHSFRGLVKKTKGWAERLA
jgi:hypothetical protein